MIASLGMYDAPWVTAANDAIWASIAARLPDAPRALDRSRPLAAIWRDPGLLLAQTCGWPLLTELAGVVRLVATPVYDHPGCDGAWHRSWIVVGADNPAASLDDLLGSRAAINGRDSNTGMNLLRASVAPLSSHDRFFGAVVVTGGHLASHAAVAAGEADIAAIDCVTHGLVTRHRPDLLAGTRVLTATPSTPGLPLVTAASTADAVVARLRDALAATLADSATAAARTELGWIGLAYPPLADYAVVLRLADQARAFGMTNLA